MGEAPDVEACPAAYHILPYPWEQLRRPQLTWPKLMKGLCCVVLGRSFPLRVLISSVKVGSDFHWALRKWGLGVERDN